MPAFKQEILNAEKLNEFVCKNAISVFLERKLLIFHIGWMDMRRRGREKKNKKSLREWIYGREF